MTLPNEFIVVGSEEMLKPLIMQLLALYYKEGGSGTGSYQRLPSSVVNYCLITLRFVGKQTNGKQHYSERSFRWVRYNPVTITPEAVRTLGEKIWSKFDSFTFATGWSAITYNEPNQGFNRVWGLYSNISDAKRLYESMLDLQGFSPNWNRLTVSTVVEPGDRFNAAGDRVIQGNMVIRKNPERPIATMKFRDALIKFPLVPEPGVLVDGYGNVMDATKFLKQYQD